MIILEQRVKEKLVLYLKETYLPFLESCSEETRRNLILAKSKGLDCAFRINFTNTEFSIEGLPEVTENDTVVNLGEIIFVMNRTLLERVGRRVTLQVSKNGGLVFVKPEKPIQKSHYRRGG
jgi:hypothetical protein